MKRVMIIAGGTGGHIFPALAVADELKKQNHMVFWLGAHYGLESRLVSNRYPIQFISVKGMRKKGLLSKALAATHLLVATLKAYRIIKTQKPDVVLAMGGYVAAAGGVAAKLARVPLVIHEQNAVAGLTNRFLAKFASQTLQAFYHSFPSSISAKTVGNPVRDEVLRIDPPLVRLKRDLKYFNVLVVGGSQGASALNQCLADAWPQLPNLDTISVWHQTGERDYLHIKGQYDQLSVKAKVEAFIDNIANAYAWADIIICRSGAMTISELAAAGVASILVPYPYAVDQHQHHNARYLSDHGAAILLDQNELNATVIINLLQKIRQDKRCLLNMAQNARKLSFDRAAYNVAMECITVDK